MSWIHQSGADILLLILHIIIIIIIIIITYCLRTVVLLHDLWHHFCVHNSTPCQHPGIYVPCKTYKADPMITSSCHLAQTHRGAQSLAAELHSTGWNIRVHTSKEYDTSLARIFVDGSSVLSFHELRCWWCDHTSEYSTEFWTRLK